MRGDGNLAALLKRISEFEGVARPTPPSSKLIMVRNRWRRKHFRYLSSDFPDLASGAADSPPFSYIFLYFSVRFRGAVPGSAPEHNGWCRLYGWLRSCRVADGRIVDQKNSVLRFARVVQFREPDMGPIAVRSSA